MALIRFIINAEIPHDQCRTPQVIASEIARGIRTIIEDHGEVKKLEVQRVEEIIVPSIRS